MPMEAGQSVACLERMVQTGLFMDVSWIPPREPSIIVHVHVLLLFPRQSRFSLDDAGRTFFPRDERSGRNAALLDIAMASPTI